MTTVGFVGNGISFEVLSHLLNKAGTQILHWQPENNHAISSNNTTHNLPPNIQPAELAQMAKVPLIFYAVPIHLARETGRQLGDVISGRQIIVHTSNSLEPATLKSISEILKEETPTQRFGFLNGPAEITDIKANKPAALLCASLFPEVHDLVEDSLHSDKLRIYRSNDLTGAEISAAYSRLIAMLAGICHGLDAGTSLQATLFARGIAEISRYVTFRGGYERTAFGLAGAGNLYADTHRQGSKSFQIGEFLAIRDQNKQSADPLAIRDQFGTHGQDLLTLLDSLNSATLHAELSLHLLRAAYAAAFAQKTPAQAIHDLVTLPAQYE